MGKRSQFQRAGRRRAGVDERIVRQCVRRHARSNMQKKYRISKDVVSLMGREDSATRWNANAPKQYTQRRGGDLLRAHRIRQCKATRTQHSNHSSKRRTMQRGKTSNDMRLGSPMAQEGFLTPQAARGSQLLPRPTDCPQEDSLGKADARNYLSRSSTLFVKGTGTHSPSGRHHNGKKVPMTHSPISQGMVTNKGREHVNRKAHIFAETEMVRPAATNLAFRIGERCVSRRRGDEQHPHQREGCATCTKGTVGKRNGRKDK